MAERKGQQQRQDHLDEDEDRDDDLDQEDADEETDEDDSDDDDDEEDQDGDDDEEDGFDEAEFLKKVESRIDRRVTGLMNKIEKRLSGIQQSQNRSGTKQDKQEPVADARGARLAYRDYISDEVKFVGREERELAASLANGLIAQQIAAGEDDEDEIGSAVAKLVADRILKLRRFHETRTKSQLRRQGLLPDPKSGQAGAEGKGKAPAVKSELQKGAALAAARHPKPGA